MPQHAEPTDGDLAAQTLRDRNAYRALVARHEAALARYVRRLLGPHGAATDDVVQEAFLKAYVNLRDYDRTRPFAPWLYRIAHNLAVSHLRRHHAAPPLLDGEDADLLLERLTDGRDALADLQDKRATGAVNACLTALDARYREVLVLRFLEEKSYGDIGDILRLPTGTVATLIRRGLARLRPALEAAGLRDRRDGP